MALATFLFIQMAPVNATTSFSGGFRRINDIMYDQNTHLIHIVGTQRLNFDSILTWKIDRGEPVLVSSYMNSEEFYVFNRLLEVGDHIYAGDFNGKLLDFAYDDGWHQNSVDTVSSSRITSLDSFKDGVILVGSTDVLVVQNGNIISRIDPGSEFYTNDVLKLRYNRYWNLLITMDYGGNIRLWNITNGVQMGDFGIAQDFTLNPRTGDLIMSSETSILVYNQTQLISNTSIQDLGYSENYRFYSNLDLTLSPLGQSLAICTGSDLSIMDMTNNSLIAYFSDVAPTSYVIQTAEWMSESEFLTGDDNGTAIYYNLEKGSRSSLMAQFNQDPFAQLTTELRSTGLPPAALTIPLVGLLIISTFLILGSRNQSRRERWKKIREKRRSNRSKLYPEEK